MELCPLKDSGEALLQSLLHCLIPSQVGLSETAAYWWASSCFMHLSAPNPSVFSHQLLLPDLLPSYRANSYLHSSIQKDPFGSIPVHLSNSSVGPASLPLAFINPHKQFNGTDWAVFSCYGKCKQAGLCTAGAKWSFLRGTSISVPLIFAVLSIVCLFHRGSRNGSVLCKLILWVTK